jgi:hypothetical protein
MTCLEVACDLRYIGPKYDWWKVIKGYVRRRESLDGNERARLMKPRRKR